MKDDVDYSASAGLFAGAVGRGRLRYMRFDTLAEAVCHAQEKLSELERRGALIESGEVRYTGDEIAALYEAVGYPLQRVR